MVADPGTVEKVGVESCNVKDSSNVAVLSLVRSLDRCSASKLQDCALPSQRLHFGIERSHLSLY